MNLRGLAFLFGLILPLMVTPFRAEAEILTNFAVTSDYVKRGIGQTNHSPAIQGGFDWEGNRDQEKGKEHWSSGLNLGTWVSNISGGVEQDIFANYKIGWGDYGVFAGAMFYHYLLGVRPNTLEYSAGFFYHWMDFTLHYTPDYFNSRTPSLYFEFKANVELPHYFVLFLGLGRTHFFHESRSQQTHYWDYTLSIGREYEDFALQLHYSNTNRKLLLAGQEIKTRDRALFFSISKIFN